MLFPAVKQDLPCLNSQPQVTFSLTLVLKLFACHCSLKASSPPRHSLYLSWHDTLAIIRSSLAVRTRFVLQDASPLPRTHSFHEEKNKTRMALSQVTPTAVLSTLPALVQAGVENKGTIDQTRSSTTIWSNYTSKPRTLCLMILILCWEGRKITLHIVEWCWVLKGVSSHIKQQ